MAPLAPQSLTALIHRRRPCQKFESVDSTNIESMFESSLTDVGALDAMASASREENAACARRLAAIGELYALRAPEDDVDRVNWGH